MHLADPELERAVHAVRSPLLADDEVASPDGTPADSAHAVARNRADPLRPVHRRAPVGRSHAERRSRPASTSATSRRSRRTSTLPDPVRANVLDRILRVLPAHVALVADLTLHLARLA